jgi:hypothetical protein
VVDEGSLRIELDGRKVYLKVRPTLADSVKVLARDAQYELEPFTQRL